MISWWRRRRLLRRAGMVAPAGERIWALLEPLVGGRRRGWDLLSGLPAVVAFLAVLVVTAVAHLRQTDAAHAYWAAGTQRLQAGDAPAAQLLLQKAVSVEADEHESQAMLLTLALAYEQSGDRQRADALMRSLAPTETPGQPAAHRYMAIRIAEQVARITSLSPKVNRDLLEDDARAKTAIPFEGEGAKGQADPGSDPGKTVIGRPDPIGEPPHPNPLPQTVRGQDRRLVWNFSREPFGGEGTGEASLPQAGEGAESPLTPALSPKVNRNFLEDDARAKTAIPFGGEGAKGQTDSSSEPGKTVIGRPDPIEEPPHPNPLPQTVRGQDRRLVWNFSREPFGGEGAKEASLPQAGEGAESPLTPTLSPKVNRDTLEDGARAKTAIPFEGEGAKGQADPGSDPGKTVIGRPDPIGEPPHPNPLPQTVRGQDRRLVWNFSREPFGGEGTGEASLPQAGEGTKLPEELLAEWHWHLSHAGSGLGMDGEGAADLQRAWGLYYRVTGELGQAAAHLRVAAEVQPKLWLQVAALEARSGEADAEQVHATLLTARKRLEAEFAADPADDHYRLLYAASLYYLDELAGAEELLEEGIARADRPAFRRLLAAVLVKRYDQRLAELAAEAGPAEDAADSEGGAGIGRSEASGGLEITGGFEISDGVGATEISEGTETREGIEDAEQVEGAGAAGGDAAGGDAAGGDAAGGDAAGGDAAGGDAAGGDAAGGDAAAFAYLRRALEQDPQCRMALERLLALSRVSPEVLEKSREMLRRLIASGNASAMAHFTLGTLEWVAGNAEQAELHMRQAMALDDSLPVVANNLAFLITQDPGGALEVALALSCQAVEADPSHPAFLDTRGRIHEKRGDLAAAAVDYQRALERSPRPQKLQQKLAEIYGALGETALAAQYREAAKSPTSAELE